MAKAKAKGAAGSVQNRHIYTRASYLYQVANYLASLSLTHALVAGAQETGATEDDQDEQDEQDDKKDGDFTNRHEKAEDTTRIKDDSSKEAQALMNASRRTIADMRSITLKTQIRCTPAVKRSVCKYCDTLQIEGRTCRSVVDNASRGRRKPWADMLLVECQTCGNVKRYPVGAAKQERRDKRRAVAKDAGDAGLARMSVVGAECRGA